MSEIGRYEIHANRNKDKVMVKIEGGNWVAYHDHQAAIQQARIDVAMECLDLVKNEMPGVPNPPDDPPNGFMEYCEGIHACHARIEKHIEQLKEQGE